MLSEVRVQKVSTSSDMINDAITFLIIHFGLMEEEVTGSKKYHVVMYFKWAGHQSDERT